MKGIRRLFAVLIVLFLIVGTGALAKAEGTEEVYSVTFVNEDEMLGMLVYEYNARLDSQELPTAIKEEDDNYTYKFDKWVDEDGHEVEYVTRNIIVYATFKAKEKPVEIDKPKEDKPEKIKEKKEKKKKKSVETPPSEPKQEDGKTKTQPEEAPAAESQQEATQTADTEAVDAKQPATQTADTQTVDTQTVNTKSNESVNITDPQVPEGAKEDMCPVHWIILLMCIGIVGYTIVRIYLANREEEVEYEDGR